MKISIFSLVLFLSFNVYGEEVFFQWERVEDAKEYQVEVRKDKKEKIEIYTVQDSEIKKEFEVGKYLFRIRSVDFRGVPGDWSGQGDFLVRPKKVLEVSPEVNEQKIKFSWEYEEIYDFFRILVKKDGKIIFNEKTNKKEYELELPYDNYQVGIKTIYKGITSEVDFRDFIHEKERIEPEISRELAGTEKEEYKKKKNDIILSISQNYNLYQSVYVDSFGVPFGISLDYQSILLNLDYQRELKYFNIKTFLNMERAKIISQDVTLYGYGLELNRKVSIKKINMELALGYETVETPEINTSFLNQYNVLVFQTNNAYIKMNADYKIKRFKPGVSYKYSSVLSGEGFNSELKPYVGYDMDNFLTYVWIKFRRMERTQEGGNFQEISSEGLGINFDFNF